MLIVRPAAHTDVPRLVAMNRAAYPELVEEGVVFDDAQLYAQQAVFPDGQLVVCEDDVVVGSIATLIVGKEGALAPHSWYAATSHGTFACHEPKGDTLYLADIYSDPAFAKRGVGHVLYEALFTLCRRRRLARIVAGGRLWNYHEVAGTMSIDTYVADVMAGTRRDRVLSGQLRAGFWVRGLLDGYLEDWRSGGYATHLVWDNPDVAVTDVSCAERVLSDR